MKLSELKYQRINFREVTTKFNRLVKQFENANSAKEQIEIDKKFYELYRDILSEIFLVNIRYSQDTRNKYYQKEYRVNNRKLSRIRLKLLKYNKILLESKFKDELNAYLPSHIVEGYKNMEKVFNKKIIFNMIKEANVKMEYMKLMSNLTFDFDGKKMTPSTISALFQNSDRELRKRAYNAYGEALLKEKEKLDKIYDRLVHLRTQKAKKLGFDSYTDVSYLELNRLDYHQDDISKFRENVKKYLVPLTTLIKEKVKNDLSYEQLMLYDDEVFSESEPKLTCSNDSIMMKGLTMYQEMSEETGNLFKLMMESDAFDVLSREGKRGGGFCAPLPKYKLPYIHANFNGSLGDLKVLTHEFGHALATRNAFEFSNHHVQRFGMEIAEVHSMSMEFFTYPWMGLFFGEMAESYKINHIQRAISFIPYGTIVDYFQKIIYDNPNLTPQKRNEQWLNLEKEFMPHMSSEGITYFEEGRRWQRQMHIYNAPFYYIDYCLAQVTAFQFYDLMMKDYDSAFNKYLEFVKAAGSKTFKGLLSDLGLKSPFDEETFIDIVRVVKESLKI